MELRSEWTAWIKFVLRTRNFSLFFSLRANSYLKSKIRPKACRRFKKFVEIKSKTGVSFKNSVWSYYWSDPIWLITRDKCRKKNSANVTNINGNNICLDLGRQFLYGRKPIRCATCLTFRVYLSLGLPACSAKLMSSTSWRRFTTFWESLFHHRHYQQHTTDTTNNKFK